MAKAKTTEFVEFKGEVLPKLIPAVIDEYWYPPVDEDADTDGEDDDDDNGDDDGDDLAE